MPYHFRRAALTISPVLALAAILGSCNTDTDPLHDKCLEYVAIAEGINGVIPVDRGQLGQARLALNIESDSLWPRGDIPVCYEPESYDSSRVFELELVKAAADAWSKELRQAAESVGLAVTQFVGFGPCTEENETHSIRVRFEDNPGGAHVKALGRRLRGRKDGIVLNLDFKQWSTPCSTSNSTRLICIRAVALHEFGHALGFTHEQNRVDTPGSCTDAPQGTRGDFYYGEWDLESVMNYCNPRWNNLARLSAGDKLWSRATYYPETIDKQFCDGIRAAELNLPSPGH